MSNDRRRLERAAEVAESALGPLGGVSPEMFGVKEERPYPVSVGSVALGPLPAGCTVIDMEAVLFGNHALVVIATDKGLFVAECGKSRLTKLDPISE
jgi:hypothetical protein